MAENIDKFLSKWARVILREAKMIAHRDRGEVSEVNGKWLKTKFRQASQNLE